MFEELEDSKKVIERYLESIDSYILILKKENSSEVYFDVIDKLKKEFNLFLSNISNISSNFMEDILFEYYDADGVNQSTSVLSKNNRVDEFELDDIKEFNVNLKEKLMNLRLHSIIDPFFENDLQFYKELTGYLDNVNKLRLNFLKFYRNIKNKYKFETFGIHKLENNFYNFTNDKMKEVEMRFSAFENNVKSVSSKYNIASDDLNKIHNTILDINQSIKENYDQMLDVKKAISNLRSNYENEILKYKSDLDLKIKEIESKIYKTSNEKLLKYTKEVDDATVLMMNEFDSIEETTKKFSEFMRDETSNKLTNDFKNKSESEMLAYYGFTALSFIIIFVAILISWNTLHTFADAHIGKGKDYTNLDLIYLSIRLIFSLIVFLSVTYTSRLASKSYTYWKKNEGIFLRLTALKSFIADMSDAKKEEIHEKLVDVYFGKDEQEQNLNQKLNDLPNNITQLLGKVVEQTSVVLDASKPKKEAENSADKPTA